MGVMLTPLSFSLSTVMSAEMAVASVLKRTIMPALSRLRFQTAAVTLPSALAGKRSNQRLRSMSPKARPSVPQVVTSCHVSEGSADGVGAAGGVVAGVWARADAASAKAASKEAKRG